MIDIIIFIVFLLLNLIVGIIYRGKSQSFQEYSIGDKKFSTATLTATMVATWASGGYLFNSLEENYIGGLSFIVPAVIGSALGLLIVGYILGPRLAPFLNNVSMADAMGSIYGKTTQVIFAISSVLCSIGLIAIQFKVISRILPILFDYQGSELTIIAATIITVYAAFGGVKAVTFTDVVQFITFGTLLPILALAIWHHIPNSAKIVEVVTHNPNFDFSHLIGWNSKFMDALILMYYFMSPTIPPILFQRLLMSRDVNQMKRSITYTTGIMLLIDLLIIWITLLILADNSNLQGSQIVKHIVDTYMYPGFKGLFGVGVIALAMSTADSALNASAVIVTHDILPPLGITKKPLVSTASLVTLVIGSLGLLLSLSIQNILKIILLSANFYMPLVDVPVLLTIFGFRTSKRCILIGVTAGCVTTAFLMIFFKNVNSFVPGTIANLIFLLGSHYLLKEKGGWIKQELDIATHKLSIWKERWKRLKSFNLQAYLQKNLPDQEYYYPLLAFYLLIATYVSLYQLPEGIEEKYLGLYRTIQYSVLVITTSLLGFQIWPAPLKNKRLLAFVWPLIIFYTLFFVGGMIVIMSGFESNQVLIFMLSLVMIALFTHLPLALTLAIAGMVVAAWIFKWVTGQDISFNQASSISFHFSHGLLLFSSLLIALFRFKEKQKRLEDKNTYLITLYEERNNELAEILGYREDFLKELKQDEIALFDHTTAAYVQQAIYRMTDYMRLEVSQIKLDELLSKVKYFIKLKDLPTLPEIIIKKHTKEEFIYLDIVKIQQLLVDSIAYVHKHNQANKPIIMAIEDATLGHGVHNMKDYTRKVKALKFIITSDKLMPPTKEVYMFDEHPSITPIVRDGEKKSLVENVRIMDAHYGYVDLSQLNTHLYVLPVNVREVRGQVMELLRAPVVADPEELNHPLAIQLEKELLDKIKNEKIDSKVINKALDTIKRYHAGVKRKSGEPFFTHPIQVALILLGYCKDQDAVVAALLHDTVEDTGLSLIQIKAMFGEQVAFIVNKVTNLEVNLRRISLEDHENISRLMEYQDERAILVKLADRLHNMRTISGHSSLAKQKHIANETLLFFVTVAEKLGLTTVANELKELSLTVLSKKKL